MNSRSRTIAPVERGLVFVVASLVALGLFGVVPNQYQWVVVPILAVAAYVYGSVRDLKPARLDYILWGIAFTLLGGASLILMING